MNDLTGLVPLVLDPVSGPLCEEHDYMGGCFHDSCGWIEANGRVTFALGPLCEERDFTGECPHRSCELIEPPQLWCDRHGWQLVTDYGVSTGFAGGRCPWANLACGCFDVDESDDLRAAR